MALIQEILRKLRSKRQESQKTEPQKEIDDFMDVEKAQMRKDYFIAMERHDFLTRGNFTNE